MKGKVQRKQRHPELKDGENNEACNPQGGLHGRNILEQYCKIDKWKSTEKERSLRMIRTRKEGGGREGAAT